MPGLDSSAQEGASCLLCLMPGQVSQRACSQASILRREKSQPEQQRKVKDRVIDDVRFDGALLPQCWENCFQGESRSCCCLAGTFDLEASDHADSGVAYSDTHSTGSHWLFGLP